MESMYSFLGVRVFVYCWSSQPRHMYILCQLLHGGRKISLGHVHVTVQEMPPLRVKPVAPYWHFYIPCFLLSAGWSTCQRWWRSRSRGVILIWKGRGWHRRRLPEIREEGHFDGWVVAVMGYYTQSRSISIKNSPEQGPTGIGNFGRGEPPPLFVCGLGRGHFAGAVGTQAGLATCSLVAITENVFKLAFRMESSSYWAPCVQVSCVLPL